MRGNRQRHLMDQTHPEVRNRSMAGEQRLPGARGPLAFSSWYRASAFLISMLLLAGRDAHAAQLLPPGPRATESRHLGRGPRVS